MHAQERCQENVKVYTRLGKLIANKKKTCTKALSWVVYEQNYCWWFYDESLSAHEDQAQGTSSKWWAVMTFQAT